MKLMGVRYDCILLKQVNLKTDENFGPILNLLKSTKFTKLSISLVFNPKDTTTEEFHQKIK
jgi:hypothetical protein